MEETLPTTPGEPEMGMGMDARMGIRMGAREEWIVEGDWLNEALSGGEEVGGGVKTKRVMENLIFLDLRDKIEQRGRLPPLLWPCAWTPRPSIN